MRPYLGYDIERNGYPLEAKEGQLFTIKRTLNGGKPYVFEVRAANQRHRNAILEHLNKQAKVMAKKPCPVTGEPMNYAYFACDTGHDKPKAIVWDPKLEM